jgi:ABC-type enterochelin transport system substrate-binding protein
MAELNPDSLLVVLRGKAIRQLSRVVVYLMSK